MISLGVGGKWGPAKEKRGSSSIRVALHISLYGTPEKKGFHHKNGHSQRYSKRRPYSQSNPKLTKSIHKLWQPWWLTDSP